MRKISRVILHCAATPDYPSESSRYDLFGAADIDAWHRERGWDGIGYHYVIRRTGVVEVGRPIGKVGAHTQGENGDSLGVCYIGSRTPTDSQVIELLSLASEICLTHGLGADDWYGHYEFNKDKTCPGFPMNLFRETLRNYLRS